jgi:hypothetical protein
MRGFLRMTTVTAGIAIVLVAGLAIARAEDSGVFKNPGDISRAQTILQAEGYLAAGRYTQGQLDRPTRQAISEYQGRHSLNQAGTLDDDTYQSLLSHEASYPWDNGENAQAKTAPSEPVAPVTESASPTEVRVEEAAPVPAPTPSATEVKEAPAPVPAPEAPPAETAATRKMPATASALPLLALSGLSLLGLGILVLVRRGA